MLKFRVRKADIVKRIEEGNKAHLGVVAASAAQAKQIRDALAKAEPHRARLGVQFACIDAEGLLASLDDGVEAGTAAALLWDAMLPALVDDGGHLTLTSEDLDWLHKRDQRTIDNRRTIQRAAEHVARVVKNLEEAVVAKEEPLDSEGGRSSPPVDGVPQRKRRGRAPESPVGNDQGDNLPRADDATRAPDGTAGSLVTEPPPR